MHRSLVGTLYIQFFVDVKQNVVENSKYWRESLLEVIRQNIARRCQQTVEKQKNC